MALSWVEIDLEALKHNFNRARERMLDGTRIVAVVKSDAYGHGMVEVSRELVNYGAHFLAVSKFWEARKLRDHGLSLPVLILLGVEACDMEEAIALDVRPVVFRYDHARLLSEAACKMKQTARIHLKVDTGMGRLGIPWDRVSFFLDKILKLPGIELEGILSHFAVADEADKSFCKYQMERFDEAMKLIQACGCRECYAHIANSAGILDLPNAHYQLVRPGIMLYGSPPSRELNTHADLCPVMSLKSRVLQLKDVSPGESIGYGRTFITPRESRIATIPVGYDDGYPRLLSNRGDVLIRGKRAPVVGRVSMNMITVDVTGIPEAAEDDEVVLLGMQGSERITAEEIADLCGTISYEIYCSIGKHHNKRFLHASCHPEN